MDAVKFLTYCSQVFKNKTQDKRWGQVCYNTYKDLYPNSVVPENIDPYYDDNKVGEFLEFILND
jgi:hypothetical protein